MERLRPRATPLLAALVIVVAFVGLVMGQTGCNKEKRFDEAATVTTTEKRAEARAEAGLPPAVEVKPTEGSAFNKLFPADGTDGYKRVFTQEKSGFAEAKLQKDGKDIATVSLADSANDDTAKEKFAKSTEKLGDHPLVTVGKNQSAVLVKDRYQVKVSSPTLDAAARKTLLEKFDLAGIARL
jgi:hypothetical protein